MASIGGLGKEIRLAGLLAKTPFKIIRSLKKKKKECIWGLEGQMVHLEGWVGQARARTNQYSKTSWATYLWITPGNPA